MRSDGSVIIDTKILDDGMQKGFESLKNGMESVGVTAENIGKKIKLSFSDMDLSKPIGDAVDKVKALEQQLASVSSEFDLAIKYDDDGEAERLGRKRESIYNRLEIARKKLTRIIIQEAKKEEIAERKSAEKITRAKQREANKQAKAAMKPLRQFGTRLGSLVSGALVFNLISAGLRNMMSYFGKALKSNDAYTQSMARLKGALLTAFQPIYEAVVPALISLMNVLTAVTQKIGQFFASLSGKNYSDLSKNAESLYNEANAIDKVSDSAKKAQKSLAGFDEINKLGKNENISSGVSSTITPDFDSTADTEQYDVATNKLQNILKIVGSIGVALETWKIAKKFTSSLKKSGGIALTVGGAFLYATNWADAFTNGIDWENFSGMLGGLAAVVVGLALSFGKTGGAIGLLVSGIGLVVVSIKDFVKNGGLATEGMAALATGVLAVGAAISLLTGSWIPIAIAAVVGLTAAILLEKEAIMSTEEAQKNLTAAKQAAIDAENDYISAVDAADSALEQLKKAEEAASITGEELYAQVQSGALDYANMTAAQKELYKAYLNNEEKQKTLTNSTTALTNAKKAEKIASLENEIALGKEAGSYDECKESIISAFKEGYISADECRDLLAKSMSEMSDDAQKTFMEDIPSDIRNGLDPNKFETTRKKLGDWFRQAGQGFVENIWDPIVDFWNQHIAPVFTKQFWMEKIRGVLTWFGELGQEIIEKIWKPINDFWNKYIAPVFTKKYWTDLFQNISSAITGKIEEIKLSIKQKWEELTKKLSEPFEKLKTIVGSLDIGAKIQEIKQQIIQKWQELTGKLSEPFEKLKTIVGSLDIGAKIQAIKETIRQKWEGLKSILSSPFDAIVSKISGIAGNIKSAWKNGINSVIVILNKFINWLNGALSFTLKPITVLGKQIYSGGTIKLANIPQIPYLAKGAVIPPNAPFMAMLGDQRHGTNIEAPLSTIQEAVASVMNENVTAMMAGFEALLEENRMLRQVVEGIEVGDATIGEAVNRYNRKMAVMRGG